MFTWNCNLPVTWTPFFICTVSSPTNCPRTLFSVCLCLSLFLSSIHTFILIRIFRWTRWHRAKWHCSIQDRWQGKEKENFYYLQLIQRTASIHSALNLFHQRLRMRRRKDGTGRRSSSGHLYLSGPVEMTLFAVCTFVTALCPGECSFYHRFAA